MRIIGTAVVVAMAFSAAGCGGSKTTLSGWDSSTPGEAGAAGAAPGGSTGSSQATGGAVSTGGATAGTGGGELPTGGTPATGGIGAGGAGGAVSTGGGAAGAAGSSGTAEPACAWSDAVLTFNGGGRWMQPPWSVTDGVLCARCSTQNEVSAGTGTLVPAPVIYENGGNMTLGWGAPIPNLIGGTCGAEESSCEVSGMVRNSQGIPVDTPGAATLDLEWVLSWNGFAWVATVDRAHTTINLQCLDTRLVQDFEPWAFNSFRTNLLTAVADWIETIEWECPD